MAHDEWRRDLRVAASAQDRGAIVRLLDAQLPDDGLQHAGDALLAVTDDNTDAGAAIATRVVGALRARGWDGDAELADALDAAAGVRAATLMPLVVEIDQLIDTLNESRGSCGYLDLHDGTVWAESLIDSWDSDERDDTDFDDRTRWLAVPGEGSREPYRDMTAFIATVTDPALAHQLENAMVGKGAFRRFYDVISHHPDEHTRWQRYSDDARLGRARRWLADHGYQPVRPTLA